MSAHPSWNLITPQCPQGHMIVTAYHGPQRASQQSLYLISCRSTLLHELQRVSQQSLYLTSCRSTLLHELQRASQHAVHNSVLYLPCCSTMHVYGSVVVTAYDFESGRPGANPEWGLICYKASINAQGLPEPSSLGGNTLGSRAAEHKGCNWTCKSTDGCSLKSCVCILYHVAINSASRVLTCLTVAYISLYLVKSLGHTSRTGHAVSSDIQIAVPSRAEPCWAKPSRAEPSRSEPSRAEPSRAEPSRVALPSTYIARHPTRFFKQSFCKTNNTRRFGCSDGCRKWTKLTFLNFFFDSAFCADNRFPRFQWKSRELLLTQGAFDHETWSRLDYNCLQWLRYIKLMIKMTELMYDNITSRQF